MSAASSVDAFLSQAEEREKAYDWLGAAEFCRKAFDSASRTDSLKLGQIQERTGYALYRAAMQAESVDEFRERMPRAVACYERAKEFYSKLSEVGKTPWMLRCDAMIAYIGYWLVSEASEKKKQIDECWKIAKEVLLAFKEADNALEYGKTYNQLSMSPSFSLDYVEDFQRHENITKEAVGHGEQAVKFLSTCRDSHDFARAYVRTAGYLVYLGEAFCDLDDREKSLQKARDYWRKAIELSEEVAFLEASLGLLVLDCGGMGTDKAQKTIEKALEYAQRTKDRFIIGGALAMLSHQTHWRRGASGDPEKRARFIDKALKYAEEAKRQYSKIHLVSPGSATLWPEAPYAEYYYMKAREETKTSRRRELSEKAMEAIPDLLSRAEKSGIPYDMFYARHVAGKVFTQQATIETNLEERKTLLEKALEHRNETIRFKEQQGPFDYWNRGIQQSLLAVTKAELAKLAKDLESERNMLQGATENWEDALKLLIQGVAFFERGGVISPQRDNLFSQQHKYGNSLKRLYDITHNREYLTKAIKAFEDSAESAEKLGLISRVAEANWKIAQTSDALGKHLKAAESFTLASNNYKTAAEKIPQLKDFYHSHAVYMQAWGDIEKARHHHERQEYGSAEEHYEKAATLHKSLKQWSYLAPNYSAWAQVEHADDLSRREQSEEALQAFEQAARLFTETKKSLQAKLGEIENLDEKTMAVNLAEASDARREYCLGRMVLEEAKILDKKGDHFSSSRKYGEAIQIFEKIVQTVEAEQEKKEFKLVATLSQAWQKMMLAEARASPELYMEASQLFEQTSKLSDNEKTSFLTLGHSRFCRALEAGTKFIDTRDVTMHAAVIQHLGSAADYYVKAGFHTDSEYAKATKLLFDAYVHTGNAEKETDPEKRAKLYAMAEKVLQTSAGSFMKAEHPEKKEQVLRLLDKVKEERELAISLTEVLHAPAIVSTTAVFSTPNPTHENAVGSERFEHADIQANLIARKKELKVGEHLGLEIELVNAGKGPALLTKITEVIPEGFELSEEPDMYRVEDSYLNMKGKRLDSLKTEEVKLVLKPKAQGVFPLKPKILYLDEDGKYKSHEPESITITVKELGIKGWIKGER